MKHTEWTDRRQTRIGAVKIKHRKGGCTLRALVPDTDGDEREAADLMIMALESRPQRVTAGWDRFVPKAWGHEEILVRHELYTLKRLVVLPGYQCSIHRHRYKTETFVAQSGLVYVEIDTRAFREWGECRFADKEAWDPLPASLLSTVTIPAGCAHRFYAVGSTPGVFLEVSTHDDPEDSERLIISGKRYAEEDWNERP